MTEKQLIGKIRQLRQIEPRKDWVVLTKKRILGQPRSLGSLILDTFDVFPKLFFQYKLALATLSAILIFVGVFGFAQGSLPGEPLFVFKKITEKTRAVFVSEEDKPKAQLELANKRLEELTKIAETHQVKKLAPAMKELQANISEAAENLIQIKEPEKAREAGKAVVIAIKELEKSKRKVEEVLGTSGWGETKEIEDAMCPIVKREIKDLGTLTEKQQELLSEAEEYLEEGKCTLAFEKILFLSYPSSE